MNNELTVYSSMVRKSTVNESTVKELNQSTVNEPMEPEMHLIFINIYSSHCSIEFFKFTGDYYICFICLAKIHTHILQQLDVEIFKFLANTHCMELND